MKTKIGILGMIAAMGIFMASCSQSGQKQTTESTGENREVKIDNIVLNPDESRVIWKGEMLGIYSHEGILKLTQTKLQIEDGQISGGSFIADLSTIVPTDENFNPEEGRSREKLVGHLSSADFFDIENHPTAKFEITDFANSTATGLLTIRGITSEEKVNNIKISKEGDIVKITGDLVFDRKKYGVSWDSPLQDRVLSNDIELKVELIGS
ncbi:MAG: YceI family protein [Bacteroidales bacterium]|nr:YceI family protein [Bacteroidales bacterium]